MDQSPRAHVAKFYGRLRLIRSVWRASKFSVFKIDWNCNFVGLLHHPFWLQLVLALFGHYFSTFFIQHVWLRITEEGSVPEMRIWSILLIKSDLKWCIHLSRSLCSYFRVCFHLTMVRWLSKYFAFSGLSTCHMFDEYHDLLYLSGESAYLHFGWHVSVGFSMELVSSKIVSWSSALRCGSASNSFSLLCWMVGCFED